MREKSDTHNTSRKRDDSLQEMPVCEQFRHQDTNVGFSFKREIWYPFTDTRFAGATLPGARYSGR